METQPIVIAPGFAVNVTMRLAKALNARVEINHVQFDGQALPGLVKVQNDFNVKKKGNDFEVEDI